MPGATKQGPSQQESLEALLTDPRRHLVDELTLAKKFNALRRADIRMQRADPRYVTRADAKGVHFMLARPLECHFRGAISVGRLQALNHLAGGTQCKAGLPLPTLGSELGV